MSRIGYRVGRPDTSINSAQIGFFATVLISSIVLLVT